MIFATGQIRYAVFVCCTIAIAALAECLNAQDADPFETKVVTVSEDVEIFGGDPAMAQKLMAEQAAAVAAPQAAQGVPAAPAPTGGNSPAPGAGSYKPNGENGSAVPPLRRSAEIKDKADPKELTVKPNEDGMLEFQFRNQPWPAVLEWLAKVSDMSLDWQELPGDTINLSTRRPYSLEETKDHINRALLLRGYTMLEHDGALTVAKTEGLNPSLVPRVSPHELVSLPPHRFVRTSFELDWLLAEEVHEEFASMISKNGTLTPLASTNRLEGMDAAANLREIHAILTQEQSAVAKENLAEEFRLVHARASQVKSDLEEFLGIQSSTSNPAGGGDIGQMMQQIQQQMQQQQQQIQQQMQSMQQAGGTPGAKKAARPRPDKIFLIANDRANTLIVHAPPNKRAIIASFIKRVDVPNEMANDFERLKLRTKVFRLVSLSPRELVASLIAMDVLEPSTKLQVNEENQSVIAYASLSDQYLIQEVIDRLDGSQRSMHVIQLRRLNADSVAGSVRFLMGGSDEEDNKTQFRGYYYDPWGYSQQNSGSKKKTDKMRVTANVQDNQLLLWVNQIELEEVNRLLVRLGEIPSNEGRNSTVRIIDASRQPQTYEYLKRLKEQWEKISPTPLIIPDESEFQTPGSEPEDTQSKPQEKAKPPIQPENVTSTSLEQLDLSTIRLTATLNFEADDHESLAPQKEKGGNNTLEPSTEQKPRSVAPISIDIDDRGNLILRSDDTAALDQLERWMLDHRPPRREYDVFKVKFARASWVCLNLKEYFAKQKDDSSNRRGYFFWDYDYFGSSRNNDKKDEQQLGKRAELQFIYDNDTNTIVVKNADDRDRATIAELIELWDVPDPKEKPDQGMRYTRLVKLNYSRAPLILNTIKEAYRDLLSANDKTFEKNSNGESKREGGSGFGFSFKGKLSLGADEVSNRILVSAEGEELLKVVCDMIEELDEAARDQGFIQVIAVGDKLDAASMRDALQKILSIPKQPNKPAQETGQDEAAAQARTQAEAIQKEARRNRTRSERDSEQ